MSKQTNRKKIINLEKQAAIFGWIGKQAKKDNLDAHTLVAIQITVSMWIYVKEVGIEEFMKKDYKDFYTMFKNNLISYENK